MKINEGKRSNGIRIRKGTVMSIDECKRSSQSDPIAERLQIF